MKRPQIRRRNRKVFVVLSLSAFTLLVITWLLVRQQRVTAAPAQLDINAPAAVPFPIFFDTVTGFELYQNGVFWWYADSITGCPPGNEFVHQANIKLRGAINASSRTLENTRCEILHGSSANVVRDSQYFYYFENAHLVRKAVNAAADTSPTPLTQAPSVGSIYTGPLAIDELGRLYWSTNSGSVLTIWRMKADNSEAPSPFAIVNNFTGGVERMMPYRYLPTALSDMVDGIVFLTSEGRLRRYQEDQVATPTLLGSGIGKFWMHVSSSLASPQQSVTFYASKNNGLVSISYSGVDTTIYPQRASPDPNQYFTVSDVTVDDVNIYIAESLYYITCPGGGFCDLLINTALYRRTLSAAENAPWELIVGQGGGVNLRSNGQYLYFSTSDALRSVPTDTPPIQIDIEALDLEVTQAIQNLEESFPLVPDHPTLVRGYARLAISTDATSYRFDATLTGKLNGQLLPGGPLHAINRIYVSTTSSADKKTLREFVHTTFLFMLPESWVKNQLLLIDDQLTLEMTVNPVGDPPENVGETPYANNKVSATARIGRTKRPCLFAVRLRGAGVPLVPEDLPGFAATVAKTRALLPVSDFRVYTFNAQVLTNDGGNYNMREKDDAKQALNDLNDLAAYLNLCNDPHWIGLLHEDIDAYFGGLSYVGDNAILLDLNQPPDDTLAHELGHNYGRNHINCGAFEGSTAIFDFTLYDPCHLDFTNLSVEATYYGFDFFDLDFVTAVKNPGAYADLMSYKLNARWPGYVFWDAMLDRIPSFEGIVQSDATAAPRATPSVGELLYLSGDLSLSENTGIFHTVYHLPDGVAPPANVVQSLQEQAAVLAAGQPGSGVPVIRQLDAAGAILSESPVVTKTIEAHTPDPPRYSFSQYLPFDQQTMKVQLVQHEIVLAERIASAHAPTITLTTPVLDDTDGTITLSWSASDGDGDALHAMILYSNDDGAHWLPLEKNVNGLEATFSTQALPAGAMGRLRLIVDDEFNTVVATSSPFTIDKHAPTPMIDGLVGESVGSVRAAQGLVERQRLPYAAITALHGLVLDPDEGSHRGERLTWSLSGPSSLVYNGSQMMLAGLAPGQYSVTLSATDSDGMTGAAAKYFEVLPIAVPDGSAPALDGYCSDAAYADAVDVPLDGQGAQASLLHSGNTLYVCFSGLTLGADSAVHMVGLRVDANNSQEPIAQDDDRGFFVDEENIPFQTVGNGSDMPVTLAPAPGYAAITANNSTGWSAEMSIAEGLVGGWGHQAAILLQYDVADPADNAHNWPVGGIYNQPNTWTRALFGVPPTLENRAPVANAGDDQTRALRELTIIALDSSASYDADLDVITPIWSQTAGPNVTLTDPTTNTIRFSANPVSEPTLLRFQLTVSDSILSSSPDEVQITLLPAKPTMGGVQPKRVYLPLINR